jgi:hypothetical protein
MDLGQSAPRRFKSRKTQQWFGFDRDLCLTAVIVVGSIFAGFLAVIWYKVPRPAAAMMWVLACLAVGSLFGFLFAIPRAVSGRDDNVATRAVHARLAANTNIEQISDWLTKLLVGVGLVELKELPQGLSAAAAYVAQGLGSEPGLVQFSAALLVFFSVEGFLGGYLATRIFFQRVFEEADIVLEEDADDTP